MNTGSTETHKTKGGLGLLLTVVLSIVGALALSGNAVAVTDEGGAVSLTPTVVADKDDYAPGERVLLSGANWTAGETVELLIDDDQTRTWTRRAEVTVGADGAFEYEFTLPDWFVATYSVSATSSSGSTASTAFTDSVAAGDFSTNVNGSGTNLLTIAAPANIAVGNVLIAQITAVANSGDLPASPIVCAPSTDWTSTVSTRQSTGKVYQQIFWMRVAPETIIPASYTFTLRSTACDATGSNLNRRMVGGIARYAGIAASGNPIVDAEGQGGNSSTTATAPAAQTPADTGAGLLRFIGAFKDTNITHGSAPRIYHRTDSQQRAAAAFNGGNQAANSSGTAFNATLASSGEWVGQTVAIKTASLSVTINSLTGSGGTDGTSPFAVATNGTATINWHGNGNGSYSVRRGGTDCGTVGGSGGAELASGAYTTAASASPAHSVSTAISAGSLLDGANILRVCLVDGLSAGTSEDVTVTKDTTAPTVTSIDRAGADPTNDSSVSWTVQFSEDVTGVDASDFALVVGGGLGGSPAITNVVDEDGDTWTVTASTGSGDGTLGLNLNDNDSIVDAAANRLGGTGTGTAGGGGAGNGSRVGQVYAIDRTLPSLSVSHTADGDNGWNKTSPVTVTVTASDAGSGLDTGSPSCVEGTTALTLTASATPGTWTTSVSGEGVHDVDCQATDRAGNQALDSDEVKLDTLAPTIELSHTANAAGWNNASPVSVSIAVGDGSGSGAGTPSCEVDDASATVSGSSSPYSVSVSGEGTHSVECSVSDAAGNSADDSDTVQIDLTAPSVTVDQAVGQADPTSTSPINFTAVFNEVVSGFDSTDVTIGGTAGGTKSVVVTNPSSDGKTFNIAVSAMTTSGTVTASIGASKATDAAGNGNSASTSIDNTVQWNAPAPAVNLHARFMAPLDESITTTRRVANAAKLGRVVPVQIEIYNGSTLQTSAQIAEGDVTLQVAKMSTCENPTATDTVETYAAAGSSNTGAAFRWSGTKMIFNLDTGSRSLATFTVGSCYRLNVVYKNTTLISWSPNILAPATAMSPAAQWWAFLKMT